MTRSNEKQASLRYRRAMRRKARLRGHIIRAYDSLVIRLYCQIRFRIINMRILEELEQYLPKDGVVLDLGCGFGLFSLYFAQTEKRRRTISVDLNARRIAIAQATARRLGSQERNNFAAVNVLDYPFKDPVDAIVVLDLLHHLPVGFVPSILERCQEVLAEDGVLLVKDVDSRPRWKAAFTWLLDKAMDYRTPVNYYHHSEMLAMLYDAGFEAKHHTMTDILPYPHMLYVCRKRRPDAG